MFSWLDSYDIYNETGLVLYRVKSQLSWGHKMIVYDCYGNEVGMIEQRIFTFLPKFEITVHGRYLGCLSREFSFFRPAYNIDYNGWHAEGSFMEWDYQINDRNGAVVAEISKQLFNWTDTYVIDVADPADALNALMFVLAIDAEKCSRDSHG